MKNTPEFDEKDIFSFSFSNLIFEIGAAAWGVSGQKASWDIVPEVDFWLQFVCLLFVFVAVFCYCSVVSSGCVSCEILQLMGLLCQIM